MQTAENRTVSLRAIDGRLARLQITARHAAAPDSGAIAAAMTELLGAAGAGIPTAIVTDDSLATATDMAFEAAVPGGALLDGLTVTRVRAFYPVIRSQLPGLDLALISAAGPGIDNATLDAACRYARRFGRRRVDIVPPSQGPGQVVDDINRRLEDWGERYPDLELATVPVATLIGQFAAGRSKADVVVATPVFADIIGEVTSVLSGAAGLVTTTRFAAGTVAVGTSCAGESVTPAAAIILAVADLLTWLGRQDVAGRIVNAWARTLEYGCHTAEFRVMSPYSRQLDGAEFVAVVASRLGDTPRSLKLAQPGTSTERAPAGRHLKLVTA